jgi:hypothetical protein
VGFNSLSYMRRCSLSTSNGGSYHAMGRHSMPIKASTVTAGAGCTAKYVVHPTSEGQRHPPSTRVPECMPFTSCLLGAYYLSCSEWPTAPGLAPQNVPGPTCSPPNCTGPWFPFCKPYSIHCKGCCSTASLFLLTGTGSCVVHCTPPFPVPSHVCPLRGNMGLGQGKVHGLQSDNRCKSHKVWL